MIMNIYIVHLCSRIGMCIWDAYVVILCARVFVLNVKNIFALESQWQRIYKRR